MTYETCIDRLDRDHINPVTNHIQILDSSVDPYMGLCNERQNPDAEGTGLIGTLKHYRPGPHSVKITQASHVLPQFSLVLR